MYEYFFQKSSIKVAARKAAIDSGIKVVPGTSNPVTSVEKVKEFVAEHGTPIILKAAFGGGGRGMRRVDNEKDVNYIYYFNKMLLLIIELQIDFRITSWHF